MSTPFKDNAQILSDQQAFIEAYERAREFFAQFEGVAGVAFGQKKTDGQYHDDIAIVVFVLEKKSAAELAPEQRIPESFEGYRTDVRVVRDRAPAGCDNSNNYDEIKGGIQIGTAVDVATGRFEKGTLGCMVKKRNDRSRENVYLLSNKHVLYTQTSGARDYVYHPFPPSPDRARFADPGPSRALGPVQGGATYGNVPITLPGATTPSNFFIDCAIARIDIDSKCCDSTCTEDKIHTAESIIDLQVNGVNTLSDVRNVMQDVAIINAVVFKVGRTTGKTRGIVRLINMPFRTVATPIFPSIRAENTIEIDFAPTPTAPLNCHSNAWFTEEGDSGAIVVDEQNRAIGMISHGPSPGSPAASSSSACHIVPVLDSLNICIPTTSGTSYGSCRARDGSGVSRSTSATSATSASEASSASGSGGMIGLAMGSEGASLTAAPRAFMPVHLADDERQRLREFLARFRETRKGRELHDKYAEVRREVGYLVRNCRPVKVAWHRNQGPAFFAHVLNHLKGHTEELPREVKGVSRELLLTRMAEVLKAHGSNPLRRAIEQYSEEFLAAVPSLNSVPDAIAYLREMESS
jgi:hypothetical protein